MKRRISALLTAAALALVVVLPGAVRAAEPYPVYAIISMTGAMAFIGKSSQQSMQLVVDFENKAGGIAGRPLQLVVMDDQTSPQTAVTLTNQLVAKHAAAVFGSETAGTCGAQTAIVKDSGPVEFCMSPAVNPPVGSYAFSMLPPLKALAYTAVRFARTKRWHKIALISSTDASGQFTESTALEALKEPENASMSLVDDQHFGIADLSVAAQIAHIQASGAQMLFVGSSGTPFGTVLRAIQDAGLTIPVITVSANENFTEMDAYKSLLPKELYFTGWPQLSPEVLQNGPVKRAILAYQGAYAAIGQKVDSPDGAGWDMIRLVVSALRKFGPDMTAQQLRDFIATMRSWNGIGGDYNFVANPQRGLGVDGSVVIQRYDPVNRTWPAASRLGGVAL